MGCEGTGSNIKGVLGMECKGRVQMQWAFREWVLRRRVQMQMASCEWVVLELFKCNARFVTGL